MDSSAVRIKVYLSGEGVDAIRVYSEWEHHMHSIETVRSSYQTSSRQNSALLYGNMINVGHRFEENSDNPTKSRVRNGTCSMVASRHVLPL